MTNKRRIMTGGAEPYWHNPSNLRDLALTMSCWWHRDLPDRPGSAPGYGPADVLAELIGREPAVRAVEAIEETVFALASHGYLIRDVAVSARLRSHGEPVECGPAVFGYASDQPPYPADGPTPPGYQGVPSTVHKLHRFAFEFGYQILDQPVAQDPAGRHPGAPHVRLGVQPALRWCLGTQRTAEDIGAEWEGCSPAAVTDIINSRQITLYGGPFLWPDLYKRFGPSIAYRSQASR